MRNRIIFLTLLLGTTLLFLPSSLSGKKVKQVHKIDASKGKKEKSSEKEVESDRLEADSVLRHSVIFSGYDKTANSSKETFHVINRSDTTIKKAGIRITYLDLRNRMLHSRETVINCDVPKGETRLVSIKSWDEQHTFYYYLSPEPKKTATPYKLSIDLLWIEP